MRGFKTMLLAILLTGSLLVINAFTKAPTAPKVSGTKTAYGNAHVNGGGTTIEKDKVSTFVFNAVQQDDGTITGHINYHYRGGDIYLQADVICMNIFGNRATIGGIVTNIRTDNPSNFIVKGDVFTFTVQDNGQGKNAASDLISDLNFGGFCSDNNDTHLPISGNIDIKE